MVNTWPEGVSSTVECVRKEVWLHETIQIQKCLHKLLNHHIDVVICCVVIEILTHSALWKETNKHFWL